jgi:hypothetical protein
MNLHELALASEGLERPEFVLRHSRPALVFLTETRRLDDTPVHDTVRPMSHEELVLRSKGMRMTDPIPTPSPSSPTLPEGTLPSPREELAVTPSSQIHFLEKSTRNPFGSMITIGRATNNDIVLPLSTVSKMHAYFMNATGPTWKITDQHSANGTYVDGIKLPDGQAAACVDGARIGFGNEVHCRFFFPESIFGIVEGYRRHVVRFDRPR